MRHFALFAVFVCCTVFTASAQPVPEDGSRSEVYLAKDDGNGNAGVAAIEFDATDIPIHCVVKLDDPGPATVKMRLIAVSVRGLRPDMQVVSASYTTTEGQNEVYFNGKPEKVWFPGMYRADIHVNGKPYRSLEFTVKGTPGSVKPTGFTPAKPPRPVTKTNRKRT